MHPSPLSLSLLLYVSLADTDGINMQRKLDQTRVLVDNLMTRINKLETQVFGLTVENKNQSTRIAELTDKGRNLCVCY